MEQNKRHVLVVEEMLEETIKQQMLEVIRPHVQEILITIMRQINHGQ